MLAKLIVCRVHPESSAAFSVAQESWADLAPVPGFQGQLGGWHCSADSDVSSPDKVASAVVLGSWQNGAARDAFMANVHDGITDSSHQETTYQSCEVAAFELIGVAARSVPPPLVGPDDQSAHGGILRLADCRLHPQRVAHFVNVQDTIWNPGMAAAPGFVRGGYWRHETDPQRFLVSTLWASAAAHDDYARTIMPQLRERADVDQDLLSIAGWRVELEPSWRVAPAPG